MAKTDEIQKLEKMLQEYDQSILLPEKLKSGNLMALLEGVEQLSPTESLSMEEKQTTRRSNVIPLRKSWQWMVAAALVLTVGVTIYQGSVLQTKDMDFSTEGGLAASPASPPSIEMQAGIPESIQSSSATTEGTPLALEGILEKGGPPTIQDHYIMADSYERVQGAISSAKEALQQDRGTPRSANIRVDSPISKVSVTACNNNIYYLEQGKDATSTVHIMDTVKLKKQVSIPLDGEDVTLHAYDNMLAVVANQKPFIEEEKDLATLWIYDLENPKDPQLKRTFSQEGVLVESGIAEGNLYLLSSQMAKESDPQQALLAVPAVYADGEQALALQPAQIAVPAHGGGNTYMIASVIPLAEGEAAQTLAVLGDEGAGYLEGENLYLTYQEETATAQPVTQIVRLGMEAETFALTAVAELEGHLQAENPLEEVDGMLYAVMAEGNRLHVLDESLQSTQMWQTPEKETIQGMEFTQGMLSLQTNRNLYRLQPKNLEDNTQYVGAKAWGETHVVCVEDSTQQNLRVVIRGTQEGTQEVATEIPNYTFLSQGNSPSYYQDQEGIVGLPVIDWGKEPPQRAFLVLQIQPDGGVVPVEKTGTEGMTRHQNRILLWGGDQLRVYDAEKTSLLQTFNFSV